MAQSVQVLLLDDGELDDVQKMLEELGVGYGRVRGGAIVDDTPAPSSLLISTPRRIDAVRLPRPGTPAGDALTRIVVVSEDSTTMRARLREVGFDYLVRRPVHAEALRLLVLHCLYAGDERRSEPRVPVGVEVSFRTGLLPRRATLADLSTRGARILSRWPLEPGRRITVTIPESAGIPEQISLKGRVVRMSLDEHLGPDGPYGAAVAFDEVDADTRHELEWILEERARGPATLSPHGKPGTSSFGNAESLHAAIDPPEIGGPGVEHDVSVPVEVRVDTGAELKALADDDVRELFKAPALEVAAPSNVSRPDGVASSSADDRRTASRHSYDRKVPAFGDRAMRVLVARDLSMGGMRIERDSGLELGDRVHLAIYGAADEEPFLVWATVSRDDAEFGMALVFEDVHEIVARQLEAVVADLPAVESLHDSEAQAMGTVVTEILES